MRPWPRAGLLRAAFALALSGAIGLALAVSPLWYHPECDDELFCGIEILLLVPPAWLAGIWGAVELGVAVGRRAGAGRGWAAGSGALLLLPFAGAALSGLLLPEGPAGRLPWFDVPWAALGLGLLAFAWWPRPGGRPGTGWPVAAVAAAILGGLADALFAYAVTAVADQGHDRDLWGRVPSILLLALPVAWCVAAARATHAPPATAGPREAAGGPPAPPGASR